MIMEVAIKDECILRSKNIYSKTNLFLLLQHHRAIINIYLGLHCIVHVFYY